MSAETVAVAALLAAPAVTALVGDRIYPDFVAQEKALPAIAMARPNTENINTIHGGPPLGALVDLEIWCMGATRADAEDLATKAVAALGAQNFMATNRLQEFDAESEVYATVLTFVVLE
jgi:hypothetical protein